jgi:hypothetical protein
MICRYIATVMKVKTDIIVLITVIGLAMICRYIATVMKVKTHYRSYHSDRTSYDM